MCPKDSGKYELRAILVVYRKATGAIRRCLGRACLLSLGERFVFSLSPSAMPDRRICSVALNQRTFHHLIELDSREVAMTSCAERRSPKSSFEHFLVPKARAKLLQGKGSIPKERVCTVVTALSPAQTCFSLALCSSVCYLHVAETNLLMQLLQHASSYFSNPVSLTLQGKVPVITVNFRCRLKRFRVLRRQTCSVSYPSCSLNPHTKNVRIRNSDSLIEHNKCWLLIYKIQIKLYILG